MRLFIVGAIVLVIFGIIASAVDSMQLFGVWWYTWFMASVLSFFVDLLWPVVFASGGVAVNRGQTTVVEG